jgi:hypothetical protein
LVSCTESCALTLEPLQLFLEAPLRTRLFGTQPCFAPDVCLELFSLGLEPLPCLGGRNLQLLPVLLSAACFQLSRLAEVPFGDGLRLELRSLPQCLALPALLTRCSKLLLAFLHGSL